MSFCGWVVKKNKSFKLNIPLCALTFKDVFVCNF